MNLGTKLLDLRKSKYLSQEEVAEKLGVTRQTISKWETDQSTPDFDKIIPICKLYDITSDELLTGMKPVVEEGEVLPKENEENSRVKRAKGIGISILLYFISIIWIMVAIPVLNINPVLSSAIFLGIIAMATSYIVYTCIVYKKKHIKVESKNDKLMKQIIAILDLIVLLIYLLISFITFAWHITWLIWIVDLLLIEIIKLIFSLRGVEDEE